MDLHALIRRMEHESSTPHAASEVYMMDGSGMVAPVLSLNWDEESSRWLLIADHYDWTESQRVDI